MKHSTKILIIATLLIPVSGLTQTSGKEIKVPFKFALGKGLYEKNCASCHGNDGFGVD